MSEFSGRHRYGPPNSQDPYADPATTPLPPPGARRPRRPAQGGPQGTPGRGDATRGNGNQDNPGSGDDWFGAAAGGAQDSLDAAAGAAVPPDGPVPPRRVRPRPSRRLPVEPEPQWPQHDEPYRPYDEQDTVVLEPVPAQRDEPDADRHADHDDAERSASAADDPDRDDDEPKDKAKKKGSFWKELPILIVVALVLTFLIQTFLARVYIIPSGSMEKTLHGCTGCTGDRILVDKVIFDFRDPEPGDVVVFRGPDGWARSEFTVQNNDNAVVHWFKEFGAAIGLGPPQEYDLVKRVIATGGQTISCCDKQNRVQVDGKSLDEPYVYWMEGTGGAAAPNNKFAPIKVPPGKLFVMGDNRNNSDDSRFQNGGGVAGTVPVDNVIGKARFIIWPPGRWGGITDYNAQEMSHADGLHAPAWQQDIPLGIGFAAAWPTLWLGRRGRSLLGRTVPHGARPGRVTSRRARNR